MKYYYMDNDVLNENTLRNLQGFAEKTAIKAGKILIEYQNKISIKVQKDVQDFATNADYASEKYILEQIRSHFPDHSILSEESGSETQSSDYRWVIDPLDGTSNYASTLMMQRYYAVQISLDYNKNVMIGVVYQPESGMMISAIKGKGFHNLNHPILHVDDITDLSKCRVYLRDAKKQMGYNNITKYLQLERHLITYSYRAQGIHEMPIGFMAIGTGSAQGYILPATKGYDIKWWDVAPHILFVEEAGGIVTDFTGAKINSDNLGKGIIASNGKIHGKLISLVKNFYSK